jgi:hypothetical protein
MPALDKPEVRIAIIDDERAHLDELNRLIVGHEYLWAGPDLVQPKVKLFDASVVSKLELDIRSGILEFDIIISDIFLGSSPCNGVTLYEALKPLSSKREFLLLLVTQRPDDEARKIRASIEQEQDREEVPWTKVWKKPTGPLRGDEVSPGDWAHMVGHAIRQYRDVAWRKTWIPSSIEDDLFTVLAESTVADVAKVCNWLRRKRARGLPTFVIVVGDSGTGVERVARLIHQALQGFRHPMDGMGWQYLKSVRQLLVGNEDSALRDAFENCTHPCMRRHPIVLSESPT